MRLGGKRALSLVAIAAIALHAVLWTAVAPLAASATADPFSVICHSDGSAAPTEDQTPASPAHSQACDHCTLCSATAAPVALDTVLAGRLEPPRLLEILRPLASAARASLSTTPKLARGPPSFA
jgi:hypothetical protein